MIVLTTTLMCFYIHENFPVACWIYPLQKASHNKGKLTLTHVLTWFSMSVWGKQDNFNWWCHKCVKKESKEGLCGVLEARQGQFTAQLGSLRALRRQGTPPMPSGQTTPCSHAWHSQRTDGRAGATPPSQTWLCLRAIHLKTSVRNWKTNVFVFTELVSLTLYAYGILRIALVYDYLLEVFINKSFL